MKYWAALLLSFTLAFAQPEAMPLSVAASGAIHATNGTGLQLHGTIGQAGARFAVSGNQELRSGFWGAREFAMPPLDTRLATELPRDFAFHPAYPNPFNPATNLHFSVPLASHVKLSVFDVTGRRIATLADGLFQAGTHSLAWNAGALASGSYFARFETTGYTFTQKLTLLK